MALCQAVRFWRSVRSGWIRIAICVYTHMYVVASCVIDWEVHQFTIGGSNKLHIQRYTFPKVKGPYFPKSVWPSAIHTRVTLSSHRMLSILYVRTLHTYIYTYQARLEKHTFPVLYFYTEVTIVSSPPNMWIWSDLFGPCSFFLRLREWKVTSTESTANEADGECGYNVV
jgi:hypothetical protein